MTVQGKNELSYVGVRAKSPPNVFKSTVAPTSGVGGTYNTGMAVGDIWVNSTGNTAFILTSVTGSIFQGTQNPTWDEIGAGATTIATINNQAPVAGNFNMVGTANQIAVASALGADTFSLVGPYTPATYTAHGVLIGEGATSIVATAVGATGTVLTGTTGADPAFAALGTNSGLTAHGVLLGENNGAIVATAAGTNGQVLLGSTAADPAFGTLTSAGATIAYTTGAASLALDVVNDGMTVVSVAAGAQAVAAQTSYNTNNGAGLVTYTLPAVATVGQVFEIVGNSSGGWTIAQRAGQTIHFNSSNTTTGVTGSLSSTNRYNCVKLYCIIANTDFTVISSEGTLTVV